MNLYLFLKKLILHHPRAVTAASRGSTIAEFALTTTHQREPCNPWSRLGHILPCHILIPIVCAPVCATAPPVRSPTKTSAILNESVTAVTASRFSPVGWCVKASWDVSLLVRVMACCLFSIKPLSEPMLAHLGLVSWNRFARLFKEAKNYCQVLVPVNYN